MGSIIETNDTLQITTEQGFPAQLDLEKHKQNPLKVENFTENIFEFRGKKGIRVYQVPPIRNFLAHNIDGKWIYWGLVHILEINHDYANKTTSGKFKIIKIYTPKEMENIQQILEGDTR
jgi:hypothetical protein